MLYRILLAIMTLMPLATSAYPCPAGSESVGGLCVKDHGLSDQDMSTIVTQVLGWLAFMFGALAMVTLVICGILYLFSAGDEEQARAAKKCIMYAIIGIIVAGMAYTIVASIALISHGIVPVL